ncbi:hypothetical protein [Nostoc sp. UCD121]|nr:hypothetical protein [Nostoc sp. UCD121]
MLLSSLCLEVLLVQAFALPLATKKLYCTDEITNDPCGGSGKRVRR